MASLFVDQLTVIDFSYLHPARGIVGESWLVDVQLQGELNDEGMVFDFGHVKKQIKQAIDEGVDHKFLIPSQLPGLTIEQDDERFHFHFDNGHGLVMDYQSPREAVYLVDNTQITTDILTPLLRKHLMTVVPDNVTDVVLYLYPESIQGAYYHYSHGLKKHQGDCQRICHGHRSPIQIFRNDQRDAELEQEWANRWQDIYLITNEDILKTENGTVTVGYEAEQGYFQLTLPERCCDFLDTDSTVELIAQFIGAQLRQQYPNESIRVKAYEGFKKGALG